MELAAYSGAANIRAADGTVVYAGDVEAGVCTGTGTLRDRMGRLVYEGGFENNQYSGQGVQYWPSGNRRYEGELCRDNQLQRRGRAVRARTGETVLYAGGFRNGLRERHGQGLQRGRGSLVYEGAVRRGRGTTARAPSTTTAAWWPTRGSSSRASRRARARCTAPRAARFVHGGRVRGQDPVQRAGGRDAGRSGGRVHRDAAHLLHRRLPACSCTRRRAWW